MNNPQPLCSCSIPYEASDGNMAPGVVSNWGREALPYLLAGLLPPGLLLLVIPPAAALQVMPQPGDGVVLLVPVVDLIHRAVRRAVVTGAVVPNPTGGGEAQVRLRPSGEGQEGRARLGTKEWEWNKGQKRPDGSGNGVMQWGQ